MISEILNALFLTYLATEYLVISNQQLDRPSPQQQWKAGRQLLKHHNVAAALLVLLCNLVERFSGFSSSLVWIQAGLQQFLHAPKILLVAFLYMITLYWDCRRVVRHLPLPAFVRQVGLAFCYVLPVYPALAVLISCGFFFLLTILDLLRIDANFLNWPIYYGTLYGPFSFVYWKVKRSVVEERTFLPMSQQQGGRRLGNV
ncbi:hypothetical protein ACA910_005949 [Epithemia clementina (nom. ined.)]